MRASLITYFAAFAASAAANPAPVDHVLHERRDFLPAAWTKGSSPGPRVVVPVRIGLTQSNLHLGHDLLMEVSEHDSSKYGKHYTEEEIHDLFAPSSETVEAVRGWLASAGIAKDRVTESFNKQWLQFDSALEELEDLLKTKYHVYTHESGQDHVACEEYHVPGHIQEHVDYITPGIKLLPFQPRQSNAETENAGSLAKRDTHWRKKISYKLPPHFKDMPMSMAEVKAKASQGSLAICDSVITPECIRAMYQIPKSKVDGGNVLGIFEDLGDHYSQQDLNLFFKAIAPEIPQGTHPKLNGIDGATGSIAVSLAGPESDLDFQISYPIIHPSNSVLYQTDDDVISADYTYAGFLNNFFDAIDGPYCTYNPFNQTLPPKQDPHYPDPAKNGYKGQLQCGKYKATKVISISYGGLEAGLSDKYQKRQCNEIMKLGMQGISVVISSGDYGVGFLNGTISPNGCLPPSQDTNGTVFTPGFPATCPYITTLGSTFLPPGADAKTDKEVATNRFGSGGGFSNLYPIPGYQKSAVENYLTNYPPPYKSYSSLSNHGFASKSGQYNAIGRAYPDFGAVGDNILIYNTNRTRLIGGTSASAPAFASILARINQERLAAGKLTIGFVNPTLYANPQVFRDVTQGNNPGCSTDGFAAAPGWDPVTGLGTPIYPKMLELFMGLP